MTEVEASVIQSFLIGWGVAMFSVATLIGVVSLVLMLRRHLVKVYGAHSWMRMMVLVVMLPWLFLLDAFRTIRNTLSAK